jgi:excisionase family DNA binding protein
MSGLVTVREAAKELRISLALAYALVGARKIRHERHGLGRGRILIPVEAIDEYRSRVTVSAKEELQPSRGNFTFLPRP